MVFRQNLKKNVLHIWWKKMESAIWFLIKKFSEKLNKAIWFTFTIFLSHNFWCQSFDTKGEFNIFWETWIKFLLLNHFIEAICICICICIEGTFGERDLEFVLGETLRQCIEDIFRHLQATSKRIISVIEDAPFQKNSLCWKMKAISLSLFEKKNTIQFSKKREEIYILASI